MTVTKINPKMHFEEAFIKITANFIPLYKVLDEKIEHFEKIVNKRFVNKNDKKSALELSALLIGQKALFEMSEEHSKFIYGIRDIVSEYGYTIEKLIDQVEYLSKELPDKKDQRNFQNQVIDLKKQMESTNIRFEKTKESLTDIREEVEPIVKHRELFETFIKKMKEKIKES